MRILIFIFVRIMLPILVCSDFASIPSKIPGPWNALISKSRSAASANELASISLTDFVPKSDTATEEDVESAQHASSTMHSSSTSTSASSSTTPHQASTYQKSPTLSPSDFASEFPQPTPVQSKRASLTPTTAVAVVAATAEHERSRSFTTVIHARSSPEFARLCCIYNSAQASTLHLMSRDSYARYLHTPQHAALVEAWKRNSVIGGLRRARSLYGGMNSPDDAAALAAMRSMHGAEMTAISL
jgi:hypothetical protein